MTAHQLPRGVVTAMLQVPALPGGPRYDGAPFADLVQRCLDDARVLVSAGFDSLQLQNMADEPGSRHVGPDTVAFMAVVARVVREHHPQVHLSVIVNWDGPASLAVAEAADLDFVRIEHTFVGATVLALGISEGCSREVMRLRSALRSSVPIVADVLEPHGVPLVNRPVDELALEAVSNGADGLYVTGGSFDESLSLVATIRQRLPDTPVYIGGGVTPDNVGRALDASDGVAVASSIRGGHPGGVLNISAANTFMDAVRRHS